MQRGMLVGALALCCGTVAWTAEEFPKPYSPPCVERENIFEFTEKPAVKVIGEDKYEITFAVKGHCDVTVGIVDAKGVVVRHLGAGVLGSHAPAPFQKNSLRQTIYWNGKDDLTEYVKEPLKMRVRVMLGLRPEFDKRLGVTHPKSIPGEFAWGIACDENGVYVAAGDKYTRGDRIRKFDHDGNYVCTVNPPPANLPSERLQGMGFVEYEAGRRELQSPDFLSVSNEHNFLPGTHPFVSGCQFALVGGRLYHCSDDAGGWIPEGAPAAAPGSFGSMLHYIGTDGSIDLKGATRRPFLKNGLAYVFLAASWDGKWLYATGKNGAQQMRPVHALFRCSLENENFGEALVGDGNPGSDNAHFQGPQGLDCDGQGRIYVCDLGNNRIQVFSPDGKHAKTIPLDRPGQIRVHRKTGAFYVLHNPRVEGKTVERISKLASYDTPAVELYADVPYSGYMALDSWTAKPRIWLAGGGATGTNVRIWEEADKEFRKLADFEEEVKKEAGAGYSGGWRGTNRAGSGHMNCDPIREHAYFANSRKFDLKSGAFLGNVRVDADDIAFDKRGYLHCHFNPSQRPGVGRLDPSRAGAGPNPYISYPECPYDYGEESTGGWTGIIKTKDQLGAKYFQDGVGANMMGDIVEQCNLYYAPKMGSESLDFAMAGHGGNSRVPNSSEVIGAHLRQIQELEKLGEAVFWIRPKPGIPRFGATAWTFNRSGELRDECAVLAGGLINGVMLDEDGAVYFVCAETRQFNGKPFLAGQSGIIGVGRKAKVANLISGKMDRPIPAAFTGTLVKTGGKATMLSPGAPIPLEERPARPYDFVTQGDGVRSSWIEGAEWLYAGASPIVNGTCTCPTMRFHTDWYKRTFVPEQYRHSIGVLDSAGNLVLHLGQYGNFDSGNGPGSKIPVGGDGIAFSDARMLSGTDNYLSFSDRGERIIVLKLNHHAEETAPIGGR